MENGLPLYITACLLTAIFDLKLQKWWQEEISPWGADIHFKLGYNHEENGNIYEAIKEYRRSLQVTPNYWQTLVYLGELYERCMYYEEAAAQYNELIEFYPDSPSGYLRLGDLYKKLGRLDEAFELSQIVDRLLLDAQVDRHINEGIIYFRARQLKEAIEEIQDSLRIQPDQALGYAALAMVYSEAGDTRYSNAFWLFKKAAEVNYNSDRAYFELSLALEEKGNRKESLKHLESCRKLINPGKEYGNMRNLVQTYIETLERNGN